MTRTVSPIRRALPLIAAAGVWALAGCNERSGPSVSPRSPLRMSADELNQHAYTAGPTHAVNTILAPPTASPRNLVKTMTVRVGTNDVALTSPAPPTPPVETTAPSPPLPAARVKADAPRTAEARTVPTPRPPAASPIGIKLERITGDPKESEDQAIHDAVVKARIRLMEKLESLSPPVTVAPDLHRIRTQYIPAQAVKCGPTEDPRWNDLKQALGKPELYVAELNLELTDDQVRQLRQEERVQNGLIGVGGLALGAFVLCGLVRAGTAAGRITTGMLKPSKFVLAQVVFWSIGPPLALFLLARYR